MRFGIMTTFTLFGTSQEANMATELGRGRKSAFFRTLCPNFGLKYELETGKRLFFEGLLVFCRCVMMLFALSGCHGFHPLGCRSRKSAFFRISCRNFGPKFGLETGKRLCYEDLLLLEFRRCTMFCFSGSFVEM